MTRRSTKYQQVHCAWECLFWWDQQVHHTSTGTRKWVRRLFKRKAKPGVRREIEIAKEEER